MYFDSLNLNQHMKTKRTPYLWIAVMGILVLSSCSQQRYAHRAKVKSNQEARATERQRHQAPEKIEPAKSTEWAVAPEAPAAEVNPAPSPAPEKAGKQVRKELKKLTSRETRRAVRSLVKSPGKVKDMVAKENNPTKEQFKQQTGLDTSNKWVKLILLGAILCLVGIVFNFWIGYGSIFYALGSLCILIGVIFLLIELLE